MRFVLHVGWLGLAALIASACGATEQSTIEREAFDREFVATYCDEAARCCADIGVRGVRGSCAREFEAVFTEERSNERLHFDGDAAAECLRAVRDVLADCAMFQHEGALVGEKCEKVYVGRQRVGEPCEVTSECAPVPERVTLCELEFAEEVGECVAIGSSRRRLGERCSASCYDRISPNGVPGEGAPCEYVCDEGLYCDVVARVCVSQTDSGDCWEDERACTDDAFCDSSGTCQPKRSDGLPCESDSMCQVGTCNDYGVCGPGIFTPTRCVDLVRIESLPDDGG